MQLRPGLHRRLLRAEGHVMHGWLTVLLIAVILMVASWAPLLVLARRLPPAS